MITSNFVPDPKVQIALGEPLTLDFNPTFAIKSLQVFIAPDSNPKVILHPYQSTNPYELYECETVLLSQNDFVFAPVIDNLPPNTPAEVAKVLQNVAVFVKTGYEPQLLLKGKIGTVATNMVFAVTIPVPLVPDQKAVLEVYWGKDRIAWDINNDSPGTPIQQR